MRQGPRRLLRGLALVALLLSLLAAGPALAQGLPSWNDGTTKQAILDFVKKVTAKGGADYVPPAQRIAVFDNDGTLWTEQPMYVQLAFALDRVKALAPQHPEWKDQQPFKAVLDGDMTALAATGEKGLVEVVSATHAGMSTEEFERVVKDWLATARHPRFKRSYTDLVHQPMLELLAYLRANGFKTYIVSGGGVEFMRPWSEKVYGVPPEQVVGSSGKLKYVFDGGAAPNWAGTKPPALERLSELNFVDDNVGKPVGIQQFIGRRPILAVGNSDGDKQMLEWIAAGSGARFMGLVHHTDATREYAYDRQAGIGKLDKALDEATARGWTVIDMTNDWKVIYPFQKK
jgi:hypothetical protein